MKSFQLILLGVFGFFILAGVFLFATFKGGGGDSGPAQAVLWGTLPQETVTKVLSDFSLENPNVFSVTYKEIPEESFDAELVEALASGTGPDIVILPQDLIVRHRNKVQSIPFDSYSERDFRDTFIDGADIFLETDGIIGLPFSVDPLVLYFNRALLANASISQPPHYWDELEGMTPKLSKIDESLAIHQSAVPFGEFSNVAHAEELLATLIMQAGNPILAYGQSNTLKVVIADPFGKPIPPAESALRFYTEFSNPSKSLYTWNRALPVSDDAFVAGKLAFYPGFASELKTLRSRNPNLNFDVTRLPQIRDADVQRTFGRLYGVAIMKNSPRITDAFRVAGALSNASIASLWSERTDFPPVRRDLLAQVPSDAFGPVFYESAIISHAFLDPDPQGTQSVFSQMISDVTSGRSQVGRAVRDASARLEKLLE
jgi:ABC-type glycerol-3-phosphate transport system substrate-binding protein